MGQLLLLVRKDSSLIYSCGSAGANYATAPGGTRHTEISIIIEKAQEKTVSVCINRGKEINKMINERLAVHFRYNQERLAYMNTHPDEMIVWGKTLERDRPTRKKASLVWRARTKNRLSSNISAYIRHSLYGVKSGRHWESLVGFTLDDLKLHLEGQFDKGMRWGNYGKWEIDHILPLCSFSFNSYEEDSFKACWALSNLRPLWRHDNRVKTALDRRFIIRPC